jgi:hypothetical protein
MVMRAGAQAETVAQELLAKRNAREEAAASRASGPVQGQTDTDEGILAI